MTNLGAPLTYIDRDYKQPYLQAWNFNVQRVLPGNVSLEVAYSGSKGTHLVGTLGS